ncbi:CRISPR-associated protein, Cse3 family [Nitrosomonas cryotolerans]|uniref:CRISPR-associated protein, Cse3 family n=1 Tax=Nitrosomonas cryotolerans ATCC 49181 TaxID=1131553 RepID=A0A1N6GVS0_9PROT|nr:type I-E CRISPR-associated protein Cas6/Cse3/CasE [Nitrosomonas cryotolerans]SFP41569.1 CRISPR-associated protein, Cse3 family [Nitrosomonas cryotolerans]SIO11614.1 CRISPR-associated protein, Cse3 family [Nitrosomonas cryotolerans ATCC 49181]
MSEDHLNDILAYASVLRLSRTDIKTLKVKDAYALHKVVYGLFEDVRSDVEKRTSIPSGIIYADKGGDFNTRKILLLSNRRPHQTPQFGEVQSKPIYSGFLTHAHYAFQITVNPSKRDNKTGKVVPIRGRECIEEWFKEHALKSWGFSVNPDSLQTERISVQTFEKSGKRVTHGSAVLKGQLTVIDHGHFMRSFTQGIGRGRAFGFGLLQIIPLTAA